MSSSLSWNKELDQELKLNTLCHRLLTLNISFCRPTSRPNTSPPQTLSQQIKLNQQKSQGAWIYTQFNTDWLIISANSNYAGPPLQVDSATDAYGAPQAGGAFWVFWVFCKKLKLILHKLSITNISNGAPAQADPVSSYSPGDKAPTPYGKPVFVSQHSQHTTSLILVWSSCCVYFRNTLWIVWEGRDSPSPPGPHVLTGVKHSIAYSTEGSPGRGPSLGFEIKSSFSRVLHMCQLFQVGAFVLFNIIFYTAVVATGSQSSPTKTITKFIPQLSVLSRIYKY